MAKRGVVADRGKEIGESAETTGTRQRFLCDHWIATRRLIIRQLPDRWFKSSRRNQFYFVAAALAAFLCVERALAADDGARKNMLL
jgi:hypothetical protein